MTRRALGSCSQMLRIRSAQVMEQTCARFDLRDLATAALAKSVTYLYSCKSFKRTILTALEWTFGEIRFDWWLTAKDASYGHRR